MIEDEFNGKSLSELTRNQRKKLRKILKNQHISRKPKEIPEKVNRLTDLEFIAQNYSHKNFYNLSEWQSIRYRALKEMGNICMLCGASPRTGAVIHVDHIKPRSLYPELAFSLSNLQILCSNCNLGKSNKDTTDWTGRKQEHFILRKNTNT